MKNIKTMIGKIKSIGLINAVALALVIQTANQACMWVLHQSELPKEADKYRKFKK